MAIPLPGLDVPVIDVQTGLMTQAWYTYFQTHQKLTQLSDVSTSVVPLNGQVLIYNSTTKLWTPGAN
jgi:hypothetical protein